MTNRITIKVQSRDEGRVIITKIGHLISGASNTGTDIAFVLNPGTDIMDVAKLLKSASPLIDDLQRDHDKSVIVTRHEPVTPGNTPAGDIVGVMYGADPLACNLATQIAWLQGFSIASECTGTFHCEIVDHNNAHSRIKYDPIGRPAIWGKLLQKYRVDCSWDIQGSDDCEFQIYGKNKEGNYVILAASQLSDFGYCIGSAIVQVILSAERKRK